MPDLLLNLMQRMTADTSDTLIGWRGDTPINSKEFIERVSIWRALLASLSGQNYALYLEDGLEFAAALLGAWHAEKTIWLVSDTLTSTNDALKLAVDGFLGEFPVNCAPISPQFQTNRKTVEYLPLDNQFAGLMVHTSGTTGVAQIVPKKLSQLAIEITTLEQLFGDRITNAEIVSTVTHQHIYGLLFKVLWPLATGRVIHARTYVFPEKLAQIISTRTCALISSPAHLKRLPDQLIWKEKINRVQALFSSGGVLPREVAQSSSEILGQIPIEIYGSSETGGIAWRQRTAEADDSWLAMPGVEWCISGDLELINVRSPHLYSDEWLQLPDRIQTHKNGRFILKGRRDRIVKIEEKRISLELIEQRLATSPLVSEVRIIAFNEEPAQFQRQLQRQFLAAVIVLSESGKALLIKEGKLAINRRLKSILVDFVESVALPRKWCYVNEFPINSQGKTQETRLRDLFVNNKVLTPKSTLLFIDKNCAEYELVWPRNLIYFSGHFPDTPILPGVAQIDWAIKTGRELFDLPPNFQAMHALKFHHVILPDQPVTLKLSYDQQKECLSFAYFSSTRQHASGRILFS